jgi:hypothetical protein
MSDKVDNTLKAIQKLIPGDDGRILHDECEAYVKTARDQVKPLLELGGKMHGDAEKKKRQLVRTCILASLTFNKKLTANIPQYKTELLNKQANELLGELRTFVLLCPIQEGKLWFGSSFRSPGTAPLRDVCKQGYALALDALDKALKDLPGAKNPGKSREKFVKYFGNYNDSRHQTVLGNVGKIYHGLLAKTLWLYYRGKTVNALKQANDWPYISTDDFATGGKLPVANNGGSTLRPGEQKQYWAQRDRLQKADDLHVKVGSQSEGQSKETLGCGIIIHELSHYLCDTRDVKVPLMASPMLDSPDVQNNIALAASILNTDYYVYNSATGKQIVSKAQVKADKTSGQPRQYERTSFDLIYGADLCAKLADYKPDKAVVNADNYAFFCRQYV